jgi:hypothetical protein
MGKINEKLVKSCNDALITFKKLDLNDYSDLSSKLEWCIGSYEYDKNPEGLIEYGTLALNALKEYKSKNPRKVNKRIIENLEKVIGDYSKN